MLCFCRFTTVDVLFKATISISAAVLIGTKMPPVHIQHPFMISDILCLAIQRKASGLDEICNNLNVRYLPPFFVSFDHFIVPRIFITCPYSHKVFAC